MNIFRSNDEISGKLRKPVCALGNYDGVHIGHKDIFESVIVESRRRGVDNCVVTFENHPRLSLYPGENIRILTTLDEKISEISKAGIENILLLRFDESIASQSPGHFINNTLIGAIGSSVLIAGYDHAFGHNREGDLDHIRHIAGSRMEIIQVMPLTIGESPVSSSRIRNLLLEGDVAGAVELLGRPYSLAGTVVSGFHRGHEIGFPTANISVDDSSKLIPLTGVYAVRAGVDGALYDGVLNIGNNPTFGNDESTIEVHLLNFNRDLYGKKITIFLIERIRGEVRFPSVDDLIAAISQDISTATAIFKKLG